MYSYKSFLDPSLTGRFLPSYIKKTKVQSGNQSMETHQRDNRELSPTKINSLGSEIKDRIHKAKFRIKISPVLRRSKDISLRDIISNSPSISLSHKLQNLVAYTKSPLITSKLFEKSLHSSFEIKPDIDKCNTLRSLRNEIREGTELRILKLPKLNTIKPRMPQTLLTSELENFEYKVESKYGDLFDLLNVHGDDVIDTITLISYVSSEKSGLNE